MISANDIVIALQKYGIKAERKIVPVDEEHFYAKPLVAVNPQFFGWITGLGHEVKINGPEKGKKEFKTYLQNILTNCCD